VTGTSAPAILLPSRGWYPGMVEDCGDGWLCGGTGQLVQELPLVRSLLSVASRTAWRVLAAPSLHRLRPLYPC
jgi:hypothetical protein